MQNKLFLICHLFISMFLLQSCQGYMQEDTVSKAKLIFKSKSLAWNIHMTNIRSRKIGLLTQVQVGIKNSSSNRYQLEYKVEWADRTGYIVDTSDVWRMLNDNVILVTGKVPEADNIFITIRKRRNIFEFERK